MDLPLLSLTTTLAATQTQSALVYNSWMELGLRRTDQSHGALKNIDMEKIILRFRVSNNAPLFEIN